MNRKESAIKKFFKRKHPSGFTLVEILLVVAIIIAVLAIGYFMSIQNYFGYAMGSERNVIVSSLLKARSEAVNNVCYGGSSCTGGAPHGLKIVTDPETGAVQKYVIFQAKDSDHLSFNDSDSTFNDALNPSYSMFLSNSGQNPISEVTFDQLSGDTNVGSNGAIGTMTFIDKNNHSFTIEINSEGRITW